MLTGRIKRVKLEGNNVILVNSDNDVVLLPILELNKINFSIPEYSLGKIDLNEYGLGYFTTFKCNPEKFLLALRKRFKELENEKIINKNNAFVLKLEKCINDIFNIKRERNKWYNFFPVFISLPFLTLFKEWGDLTIYLLLGLVFITMSILTIALRYGLIPGDRSGIPTKRKNDPFWFWFMFIFYFCLHITLYIFLFKFFNII